LGYALLADDYYFDTKEDVIKKRFLMMLSYIDIIKRVETESFQGFTVGPTNIFLKDI
jgi:hypothetical protein